MIEVPEQRLLLPTEILYCRFTFADDDDYNGLREATRQLNFLEFITDVAKKIHPAVDEHDPFSETLLTDTRTTALELVRETREEIAKIAQRSFDGGGNELSFHDVLQRMPFTFRHRRAGEGSRSSIFRLIRIKKESPMQVDLLVTGGAAMTLLGAALGIYIRLSKHLTNQAFLRVKLNEELEQAKVRSILRSVALSQKLSEELLSDMTCEELLSPNKPLFELDYVALSKEPESLEVGKEIQLKAEKNA